MTAKKYRVLISDPAIHPNGISLLEEVASLITMPSYTPEQELVKAAQDVDAILARTAIISGPVVRASDRLKIVSRHGVGVDNVDLNTCTELGVVVTITGEANSQAVSEHAFGCFLNVANKIAMANHEVKAGRWERERFVGVELYRKVLGIVGLGRIGSRLARLASGFEMEIIAYDPYVEAEANQHPEIEFVDLETLLRRSDFISLHMPLTGETRHMIDAGALDMMKPNAVLVNTARGGLIDEEALFNVLKNNRIAGAALDVFEQEPLPANHPLTQLDNLVCSPHVAGQTKEALERMAVGAAENILHVFRGEVPPFVVNPDVLKMNARTAWKS